MAALDSNGQWKVVASDNDRPKLSMISIVVCLRQLPLNLYHRTEPRETKIVADSVFFLLVVNRFLIHA